MNSPTAILSETDSELVRTYHERVAQALVYVESTCMKTGLLSSGTGTVVGFQGNPKDGWLPIVVSAGHVVRSNVGAEMHFRLQRFSFADPANPTVRVTEFTTGKAGPRDPCGIHYTGPHNDLMDIGFLRGPKECVDGKPFFELDAKGEPSGGTMPIEDDGYFAAEGSRVAWAGFPGIAASIAGRPQPCYFEGSVSALILHPNFGTYLLDGHNTFGVSGGPVWSQKNGQERSRMIGVVSNYQSVQGQPQMPGFVNVAPVQLFVGFLRSQWRAQTKR